MFNLVCARPFNYRPGSTQQNLKVQPRSPRRGVPEIQSHHFIEADAASTHDLPQPRNSGLHPEQSTSVPCLVGGQLIWYRRTRSDKRHIAHEDVKELREFVKAGAPEYSSQTGDSLIVGELVNAFLALAFALLRRDGLR